MSDSERLFPVMHDTLCSVIKQGLHNILVVLQIHAEINLFEYASDLN